MQVWTIESAVTSAQTTRDSRLSIDYASKAQLFQDIVDEWDLFTQEQGGWWINSKPVFVAIKYGQDIPIPTKENHGVQALLNAMKSDIDPLGCATISVSLATNFQ